MRLIINAEINYCTGYGIGCCRKIIGLLGFGHEVGVRTQRVQDGPTSPVPAQVKRWIVVGRQPEEWELLFSPMVVAPTPGKKTIYFTTLESETMEPRQVALLNQAWAIVVPSRWNKETMERYNLKVPVYVCPQSVDPVFGETKRHKDPKTPLTFGCAGQAGFPGDTRKNLDRIVEAFQMAFPSNWNYGLCVRRSHCNEAYDPRILYEQHLRTPNTLAGWYAGLDVFVSASEGEGWGRMVQEAMAMGVPVIARRHGGHLEFSDPWGGFWLRDGTVQDIVHTMQFAAESRSKRKLVSMVARWRVGKFTDEYCAKVLDGILREVMGPLLHDNPVWIQESPRMSEAAARVLDAGVGDGILTTDFTDNTDKKMEPVPDLTICITSFNRPKHLRRALASVRGMPTVVSVMGKEPFGVLMDFPEVTYVINRELGCNESWLQAVYRAKTKRVLVLHDDDYLAPEFAKVYRETIAPALDKGDMVTWRGAHAWEDGRITATEYHHGPSRALPIKELQKFLLRRGKLSLSPIVTVFDRATLIEALKEADEYLTNYMRPGMLLGTEVLAYLRCAARCRNWYYIDQVLSYYGVHPGSGTYAAEQTGDLSQLTAGYDEARQVYQTWPHRRLAVIPESYSRLLLTYWPGLDNERVREARRTWEYQFQLKTMLDFPWTSEPSESPPLLHDLFDALCEVATEDDVLVYANLDLGLTVDLPERVKECLRNSGGVCVAWRRTMAFESGQWFASVRQGKIDGGVDLVAVTRDWWRTHRDDLPRMHVASSFWDFVFRVFAERLTEKRCYLSDGTFHAPHPGLFEKLRLNSKEQRENYRSALGYFRSIGHEGEKSVLQMGREAWAK